jgi:hypothetical protein
MRPMHITVAGRESGLWWDPAGWQIFKERMADETASAFNPVGGQKFRSSIRFCRGKSVGRNSARWGCSVTTARYAAAVG